MILKGIGLLGLGVFFSRPAFLLYKNFFYTLPDFQGKYGKGSYALVTGATDGIGKGFSEVLASKGINIILVSRDQTRLDKAAKELNDKYGVKTVTYAIDLSKASEAQYEELKKKTSGLDISILINNAGVVVYDLVDELKYNQINEIVTLNCSSIVQLLNIYLPQLEKRSSRSAVINTSSFSGFKPMPYMTLYSSTKTFASFLARGLGKQYEHKIDFLSYQPGTVITKAVPGQKPAAKACTIEQSVNDALKDLGKRAITHGYYNHEFIVWVFTWLPEWYRLKFFADYMPKLIKERKEAMLRGE
jgi:17beta-estradiol 17-dehydrogenase / very-long-chain 3-oxoacyl-CoA reductase